MVALNNCTVEAMMLANINNSLIIITDKLQSYTTHTTVKVYSLILDAVYAFAIQVCIELMLTASLATV